MPQTHANTKDIHYTFLQDFANHLNRGEIELPAFPDVYARILSRLEDPDLSMADLAQVVTAAPDLCVRVLRMANSALLNRSGIEVTDVTVAVSRLGVQTVRNAAVSLAAREAFDIPRTSPLYERLSRLHSQAVTTAAWAYAMAGRLSGPATPSRDDAMLTGLLHNVGEVYLLTRAEEFPELAEPQAVAGWSPGVGAAIVENWGFPSGISQAIELQNIEERSPSDELNLHDLLIVGRRFASNGEATPRLENSDEWEQLPAFRKLNISAENLESVKEVHGEEVESFLGAFS